MGTWINLKYRGLGGHSDPLASTTTFTLVSGSLFLDLTSRFRLIGPTSSPVRGERVDTQVLGHGLENHIRRLNKKVNNIVKLLLFSATKMGLIHDDPR